MKTMIQKAGAALMSLTMLAGHLLAFPVTAAGTTDLYVGYSSKSNNFGTVQEAVNKAASINPTGESERVTIHIAPGTYREQVVVQTPYISFVNDEPSKEVLLTWYYGIGYKYYSANAKGYYDAASAQQTSAKNPASYRWGATVQLWPKATYFKAQNITFENSFNRYVTAEEIKDGVELTGDTAASSITFKRTSSSDVKTKAATERAAALSADAVYSEFMDCKFLSSQDTLYTGGSPQYYKNCHIEGNTDYIFGDTSAVFDQCELSFYGYSDGGYSGYITAERDESNDDSGYLFNNCTITTNSALKQKAGYLGRPWRDSAKVLFLNTTIAKDGIIDPVGWYKMSGIELETVAGFKEYGTKLANGTAVDLSKRKGHTLSASDAAGVKPQNYMKNWTPTFLNASSSGYAFGTAQAGNTSSSQSDAITLCGGWFETAYAEWDASKIGSNVKVSYKLSSDSSYTGVDAELIRGNRVDIPGLKGGQAYDVKIEGSSGSASCTVTPMRHDRSGYAHWNYTSGVGAYKDDGTLKSGVTVIYVTNANKDTITYGGKTGLYNIFYSAKPKNVVFRCIGKIDVPAGAKANDGKQNDGSSMLYLQYGENVTIEGIGYNADLNKWGFEMKRCTSCEVRNLWLGQYPDDGISMTGDKDNKSTHMWIHNNMIEKGYNAYAGNGTVDDDKSDGDGSADIKWSEYVTLSYNQFVNCHKTSLIGGGPSQFQDWITYHHNWFKNTESRNPRARNSHIHSYNNYFTANKQYGIGASYNSKIFSEANYFEGTNLPLDAVNMGSDAYSGTIKSYNDKFDNCKMGSGLAYKIVSSRTEKASINNLKSGGDAYDNFDLSMYSYTPQTADAAKTEVKDYSGRMLQKAYGSSTVTPPTPSTSSEYILDASKVNTGSYSIDVKYNSVYTIAVSAADAVTVTDNSYTSADGKITVSHRINLGGKGDTTNRSIRMNVPTAGTVTVYMTSSSKEAARTVNLLDAQGQVVSSVENVVGESLNSYTLTVPFGGEYYIASAGSGLYLMYAQYTEGAVKGASIDTSKSYVLQNAASGQLLTAASAENGADTVQKSSDTAEPANTWTFHPAQLDGYAGYYMLKNGLGELFLDIDYGRIEDGTKIGVYENTNANAQYFKLVKNADGSYKLLTAVTGDQSALDISSAGTGIENTLSASLSQNWFLVDAAELEKPAEIILGDLNQDNVVDVFDLVLLKRAAIAGEYSKEGDINKDGAVNAADAKRLQDFILGRSKHLGAA